MSGQVLILGAASGIARAVAVEAARSGHSLILAARKPEPLEALARDLEIRFGVKAATRAFDALDFAGHAAFVRGLLEEFGDLEGALLAFGAMGVEEGEFAAAGRARHPSRATPEGGLDGGRTAPTADMGGAGPVAGEVLVAALGGYRAGLEIGRAND